jgi:hypothetical protein
MYTTGQDYTAGTTTSNYTTQQYNYEYQYQMPTTTKTTTTTTQYTTSTPVTTFSTQQYTVPDYTQGITTTTTDNYVTSNVEPYPSTVPGVSTFPSTVTTLPGTVTTVSTPLTTVSTPLTTVSTPVTTTTTVNYGVVPGVVPGVVTGGIRPQPVFKLLRQGSGISPNEQQGIVSTAMLVYQYGITPISNNTASRIKKTLGGDWIVIVYPQGKPVDFNMTCVQGNDYMYFTLNELAYQVCRLR